jgi:hypothetical protein
MKAVAFLENVLWNAQTWAERSCLEIVEANVPIPASRISRRNRNLAAHVARGWASVEIPVLKQQVLKPECALMTKPKRFATV